MLTWIVGALHLVSAFSLVGLVLLHSGKGGGVSDMFGGSVGATAAGSTVAEQNLSRITVVVAVTFGFTTLIIFRWLRLGSFTTISIWILLRQSRIS